MRRKMVVLKVFCSYWVRKGVLNESPFWRIKLSFGRIAQLPRSLSQSEMRGLLVQAKKCQDGSPLSRKGLVFAKGNSLKGLFGQYRAIRNLALVDLLFATGMRVGEVSALNMRTLQFRNQYFGLRERADGIVWRLWLMIKLAEYNKSIWNYGVGWRQRVRLCSSMHRVRGYPRKALLISFLSFVKTQVSKDILRRTCHDIL